ncbi:MAG: hypothetical protein WCX73_01310 [Candidatus Pacearchaeota archaeon]|jgi:hypothetical protein
MSQWKIKTKKDEEDKEETSEEDDEEISEDDENLDSSDLEQNSEPLENILQGVSSRPAFRFNREVVSPFLEQEPIENLEQGLKEIPSQSGSEKTNEPEQPILYNAPKYSGSYDSGDYENTRKQDTEMDISGGALITRETMPQFGEQRGMNFGAWQQQNMDRFESQGEKYQIGKTEKFKQRDDLPFQGQEKPKRF